MKLFQNVRILISLGRYSQQFKVLFMKQKNMMGLVKSLLKGEAVDGQTFWASLQQQDQQQNAAYFCQQLFQSLTHLDKKPFIIDNQQRIYATLLAVQYYKNRKPKPQALLDTCNKFLNKGGASPHSKWVLEHYVSLQKDKHFAEHFMSSLALIPAHIDCEINILFQIEKQITDVQQYKRNRQKIQDKQTTKKNYQLLKKLSYPQNVGIESKIMSMGYICYIDYVRSNINEVKNEQFQLMIKILKVLYHPAKNSTQSLHYLSVFLHFIINCITFHSCTSEILLKDLMACANHLKNYYGVVGQLGNQLFDILAGQIRIPGFAFRKKLRYDFPSLDIKQSAFLNKQFYFVTESQDCFSCHEDRSLINLRKLIIWHCMKVSGLDEKLIAECIVFLRQMAGNQTFHLYFKSLKILQIASQIEVFLKIKQILKKNMSDLLDETKLIFKANNKRATAMQIQQFDSLIQEDNSLHIFRYPSYEIIHVPLVNFINSKAKLNLYEIVNKSKIDQSPLNFYKGSIPIIFYGDSVDFIHVVGVLSRLLEQSDVQLCRQIRVYYLPKPQLRCKPEIGAYIASKDIWYRRFVYNVFKYKLLFPYMQPRSGNKNLFPSYIMNKTLHMYIKQAKRIFQLKVYRCFLKHRDSADVENIYFTSSFMMGLFTQAQIIRTNKLKQKQKFSKYSTIDPIQIIKQKVSKNMNFIADIVIQAIEPLTNTAKKKTQRNIKFEDLQICSLPRDYFMGEKPDPFGNGLKMALLTQANSKVFWKQLENKQNFRQNKNIEEIVSAFQDLFIKQTIKSISIKNKNENASFKVLVDGVPYNKVESIFIESPTTVNGFPLMIPIYTFLPFK